jgi:hypothetical protein
LSVQAAREALVATKDFPKGPDYANKFGFVFGDGLVTSGGDKHKGKPATVCMPSPALLSHELRAPSRLSGGLYAADRKIFNKFFVADRLLQHLPVLCQQTLNQIEKVGPLEKVCGTSGSHGRSCSGLQVMEKHVGESYNVEHFFAVLSLRMFCRYCIDHEFDNSGTANASYEPAIPAKLSSLLLQ